MAGKTPSRATANFIKPLRRSLSCITRVALRYQVPTNPDDPFALILGNGEPVRLSGTAPISLTLLMNYRLVEARGVLGPWKVKTTAYFYMLDDADGKELVVYHWNPQTSAVWYPHIHPRGSLRKFHIPTARISIEDIIRFSIVELGVKPLNPDWEKVLLENQRLFERHRTWSDLPTFIQNAAN